MFLNTLFVRRLFCGDKIALCFKSELFFMNKIRIFVFKTVLHLHTIIRVINYFKNIIEL